MKHVSPFILSLSHNCQPALKLLNAFTLDLIKNIISALFLSNNRSCRRYRIRCVKKELDPSKLLFTYLVSHCQLIRMRRDQDVSWPRTTFSCIGIQRRKTALLDKKDYQACFQRNIYRHRLKTLENRAKRQHIRRNVHSNRELYLTETTVVDIESHTVIPRTNVYKRKILDA